MQWNPAVSHFRMNPMPAFMPPMTLQHHVQNQNTLSGKGKSCLNFQGTLHVTNTSSDISWDKEFSAHELQVASQSTSVQEIVHEQRAETAGDSDELARTAGRLLDNLKHEQNPKFQQSQFMGLMRKLRDGEMIVDGNKMVESDTLAPKVDKGKAKAEDPPSYYKFLKDAKFKQLTDDLQQSLQDAQSLPTGESFAPFLKNADMGTYFEEMRAAKAVFQEKLEDINQESDIDKYLREDNLDYTKYWNELDTIRGAVEKTQNAEAMSWDKLQEDWDRFEATESGIKAITHYQFQENNPYVLGDSSRTRNHLLHSQGLTSILEVSLNCFVCKRGF